MPEVRSIPKKSLSWFSQWTLTPTFMSEDPVAVRHSLIRLLSVSSRNSLDSKRAIELFSQEHWGLNRYRIRRLLTEWGDSNSSVLGEHANLALRLGEATQTTPAVWEELTIWERPVHTETAKIWRDGKAYWVAVAFALMVVAFLIASGNVRYSKWLVREFEFAEGITLLLVLYLDWFIYLGIAGAISFAVIWILWKCATWPSGSWLRRLASRMGGDRAKKETAVCRLIAMNLASGVSVRTSVEHLAGLHQDRRIQRRLQAATDLMATGKDEWQSLTDARLLHETEKEAIIATEFPDVQAWVLNHLALRRHENQYFKSLRRKSWKQPIVTLAFGSFVLVIAYTVFSTLSQLALFLAERHG